VGDDEKPTSSKKSDGGAKKKNLAATGKKKGAVRSLHYRQGALKSCKPRPRSEHRISKKVPGWQAQREKKHIAKNLRGDIGIVTACKLRTRYSPSTGTELVFDVRADKT